MTNHIFETVIGLEVHLQFNTQTKVFCGCPNKFGEPPNTCTCPVCLGLPGSLPVLNRKALESAIKVGLALGCRISPFIKFDRKNYYYPDLPKGYQISQYDHPIAKGGHIMIPTSEGIKKIRLNRAHLEEDAGKLIHDPALKCSLVDYNRTGTPLLEIVTEPDINSPEEAYEYLQKLKLMLQYLDVSDCDMEKGSLRCDANISLRKKGEKKLGTKAEIKNMNSFKAVKAGLEFEEERQSKILLSGKTVAQETRLWDENKSMTISMRSKEEAHDYRYFPEPDLVPFTLKPEEISSIRESLPELPDIKFKRFQKQYQLSDYDIQILVQDKNLAEFFEDCVLVYNEPKKVCNWIATALLKELHERKLVITAVKLEPPNFADLIRRVENGEISHLAGKDVLSTVIQTGKSPGDIIQEQGLTQVSDEGALGKIIEEVLQENEKTCNQIKEGKQNALGFLVGQTMRKTGGKANPKIVGEIIRRRLLNE